MTSSPEPIASWSPPDLGGPLDILRRARGAVAPERTRANGTRPGLATHVGGDTPAAWSLPDLQLPDRKTSAETRTPEAESYALGFEDGARQGEERALENLRPVLDALFKTIEQIESSRARFEHDRERNLRGLALVVAQRLMQREVAADPTIVRDLVQRALELMPPGNPIEARLNPADLAAIAPELEKLAGSGRALAIEWTPDATLPRGGFLLEGPQRLVDGRTDTALRTLFDRLEHD